MLFAIDFLSLCGELSILEIKLMVRLLSLSKIDKLVVCQITANISNIYLHCLLVFKVQGYLLSMKPCPILFCFELCTRVKINIKGCQTNLAILNLFEGSKIS